MRPIKFLLAALLLLSFSVNAQTGKPSGYPVTNSTGWFKWGYAQADSGRIDANRDTMWKPSIIPTTVYWQGDFWTYTQTTGQRWNKSGGAATDSAVVLKSVTQIASLSNAKVNSIIVIDTIRGGSFLRYSGTDAADNGMIFTDGIGQKWLRQTSNENDKINILWYGARQNSSDCRSKFIDALHYIYGHPRFRTLYVPYDSVGSVGTNVYYLSDSILIDRSISILGDGTINNPTSYIYFPAHTTGFVFKFQYGEAGIYPSIKNIRLRCGTDGTYNTSKHAITTNNVIDIQNVVVDNYDGDGLHISACGNVPSGDNNNYGNADRAMIINFSAFFCNNGVFVEGCDANAIAFINLNVSQNRRWGAFDNGFLGNTYSHPHMAFDGVPAIAGANSVVLYSGKYYTAKPGFDGYWGDAADSNYNKQPDINPTYWYEVTAMSNTVWNSTTRYYSGGPICIKNDNSWSQIYSPYTEGSQPPIYLNSRSIVYGGDNGADVKNGIFYYSLYGEQWLKNAGFMIQKYLHVGTLTYDASSIMKVYNDNAISGSFVGLNVEGSTGVIFNKFTSSITNSYYGLTGTDFFTQIGGLTIHKTNSTGFHPWTDNTFDLGSTSYRWKDIYAALSSGAGIKQVRWDGNKLTTIDTLHSLSLLTHRGIKITASVTGDSVYIDDFVKVATTTSASTITPNCDTTNMYTVTALATDPTFAAPSGTPYDGQPLTIRVKDNGTSRTLTWNSIYRAGTDVALPTATTISKQIYSFFIYNAADSKWDLINVKNGF